MVVLRLTRKIFDLFVNISLGTELESGIEYVIVVRVINMVGLSQEGTSDGFTVDATAPSSGRVTIVSPSSSNFDIHQITTRYIKNISTDFIYTGSLC